MMTGQLGTVLVMEDDEDAAAFVQSDPETCGIPVILLTGIGKRLGVSASTEEVCSFQGIEPTAFLEMPVDPCELRCMTERLLRAGAGQKHATESGA